MVLLVAANFAVYYGLGQAQEQNFAKLYFFDVGQGDAIYLRTLEGNDVVIDGGPADAVLSKLGQAMPWFDRTIEFLVLTHPHADHLSGLIEILKRYQVKKILVAEVAYDSKTFQTFLEILGNEHAQIIRPRLGQRIYLDRATVFDVYYPLTGKFEKTPRDINDSSVVGKITFGKMNILLTGDAGQEIETLLLGLNLPVASEILKVGHHGSRHSTSKSFVEKVRPEYSAISVGRNSYGHPHPEVLGVLAGANTQILRTDERGDIAFFLYPDRIEER